MEKKKNKKLISESFIFGGVVCQLWLNTYHNTYFLMHPDNGFMPFQSKTSQANLRGKVEEFMTKNKPPAVAVETMPQTAPVQEEDKNQAEGVDFWDEF